MGKLAVFIQDTKDFTETEGIGQGTAVYIHFRKRRGLFSARRLTRYLRGESTDCFTCDASFAARLGLARLSGSGARLIHACAPGLLPEGTTHLALFPGVGWKTEAILELARRVRFLELIGGAETEALREAIEAETGLSVPVFSRYKPAAGKLCMRLPGAPGGSGLDLSDPHAGCTFLPPAPLRRLYTLSGGDGDTLDALLSFFEFPPSSVHVFLSNFTKPKRDLEKDFM